MGDVCTVHSPFVIGLCCLTTLIKIVAWVTSRLEKLTDGSRDCNHWITVRETCKFDSYDTDVSISKEHSRKYLGI